MLKTAPYCANHVSVHPPLSQIRVGALLLMIRTGFCRSAIGAPAARSSVSTSLAYVIIRSEHMKSNSQPWSGFVTDAKAHCLVKFVPFSKSSQWEAAGTSRQRPALGAGATAARSQRDFSRFREAQRDILGKLSELSCL